MTIIFNEFEIYFLFIPINLFMNIFILIAIFHDYLPNL